MTHELKKLKSYIDEKSNKIIYDGEVDKNINILFKGSNNTLIVDPTAKINFMKIGFYCSNSFVTIGRQGSINIEIQVGQDCSVSIGDQCYFTAKSYMTVAEGTHIKIERGCIIASGVTFRTNDSHPIFDIHSGVRVNVSRNIFVGEHVWIGEKTTIQKGAHISEGSVIGMHSMVTSRIPNNCIAAGIPAKIIKKDIAWEAPHLVYAEPYYKPDVSCVTPSQWWNETNEIEPKE